MKKVADWYLPDSETHFSEYLNTVKVRGFKLYQMRFIMEYLTDKNVHLV